MEKNIDRIVYFWGGIARRRIRLNYLDAGCLRQLMLDGIARGGATRGYADLVKDGAEVGMDGTRADYQLFGDLRIGKTPGNEAENFDFARGQAIGIGG